MKLTFNFLKTWVEPWREYVSEMVGVALIVFLGSSIVVTQSAFGEVNLLVTALGFGMAYASILYSTNHVSGGFLSPAVVVALWTVKRLSAVRTIFYLLSQFIGSVLGALLVLVIFGQRAVVGKFGAPAVGLGINVETAMLMEALLGAIFVFLIFAININKTAPNVFGPIVFGFFLTVATIISYPVSGSSINIASSFGPLLLSEQYQQLVMFLGVGFLGSLVGVAYEYVFLRRRTK